ncbi:mechanosensitive ion channel protein 6-like [Rhodamnia argentea]|uniref:Mechanosensitive ion channel protein n=1 Tax=Rhodamnia argentea TaxID=178133 RepID=A0A8B8MNY6_9MYRT|nr:mechanosensitive ion channel protein 6-like [Rhodamnia argentea]
MESLRKSFKSYGSNKLARGLSSSPSSSFSRGPADSHEDRVPILGERTAASDLELGLGGSKGDESDCSRMLREPSIEFWKGNEAEGPGRRSPQQQGSEDPPSRLIGRFLHEQRASGDVLLDMDLEMEELRRGGGNRGDLPPVADSPQPPRQSQDGPRVSFQQHVSTGAGPGTPQRRHRGSPSHGNREDEVVKCTSSASFERKSSLLRAKTTRSRLMDPPEVPDRRSGGRVPRSGQLRSGMLGRAGDEEEDDLFLEEDLPEEFKKAQFGVLTLLQWVSLVLIIGALVCTLAIPLLKRRDLWKLKLWKWDAMVLVLICGRLVSGWMIRLVVFFIEQNFLLRKRVLYFVYGLRKAVQNCLWLGLVLIAWHALFDKKVERETNSHNLKYVTKVLVCFLVGTLLWLVKTLIIKVLASSFHVSTYFDRIQESLFNQYVIETLSGLPVIEIQRTEEEEQSIVAELQTLQKAGAKVPPDLRAAALPTKSGTAVGSGGLQTSPQVKNIKLSRGLSGKSEGGITIDHLHKLNPKNVSAWNMKRLINTVRHGFHSTLDERIQDSTHEDESATMIRSENEAKAAARKIFRNVAKHNSKFIYLEDLMRFMRDDEALKTMSLFEGADESKKISKSCLKNWLVNAFRERRALALTLNDTKTAVNKLHRVVNVIVGIVILIIWLLILGIATTKFLLFLSSQLVLVAFVFGNTCKTVFEAIIFLFVMHPYDVGDRCEIDGVQMVVEEMNILTTVFLRYDNQKIIYPNSTLSTKAIGNYYRSPDMGDAVEFCVHISTPAEKIAAMKHKITSYIDGKKEHWYSTPMIIMKDIEELNKVRIAVWLCHKMNHQNMGEKFARRALLIEEMVKMFRELDIQYRLLPLDINVRAMPAQSSARVPPGWANGA